MFKSTCLNSRFSTTKILFDEQPKLYSEPNEMFKSVFFLPDNKGRISEGGLRTQGLFKSSTFEKPLLSIVTIVFNGQQFLEETILSVINQNYDNVEYIVIDGGSTDGSLDIIKKYESEIDYWVSEKDQGISDAFNKGVTCCSGKLIGLINADDFYEQNSFSTIISTYLKCKGVGELVLYGNTYKITIDGIKEVKNNISYGWFLSVPFSHCSSFLTDSYYKKFGLYDNKYKIGMDVDLLMRGLNKAKYISMPDYVATQRDGGVSDSSRLVGYNEYRKIAKSHFGFFTSGLGYIIKVLVFYRNKVFK